MNIKHLLRVPEQHVNKEGGGIAGYCPRNSKEGKMTLESTFTEEGSPKLALKKGKIRHTRRKRGDSAMGYVRDLNGNHTLG